MLQRFITVTLITCVTGLLTACDNNTAQLNPAQPAPATENTLQFKLSHPPSAEMKNELKRAKYQLQQDDRREVEK